MSSSIKTINDAYQQRVVSSHAKWLMNWREISARTSKKLKRGITSTQGER